MKNVDTKKISKEINDALMHRACVMRSGNYLSKYLIHINRSVDAIRLLARCSIHDISKIKNTEEFLSLASIVDEIDAMHDVSHVLSSNQQDAIRLHWKNNSHHPEYYESPNDMSDLDIMEMACDCHARSKQYGTDLIEYITKQQELRFHFDSGHFRSLKRYCMILVELTKEDDYGIILNDNYDIQLDFKDTTMQRLESFDDTEYVDRIKSERLYLTREDTADFASVAYAINTREDNDRVGFITLKFNGHLEFRIYENYRGMGYLEEAIASLLQASSLENIFVVIKREDEYAINVFKTLGFKIGEYGTEQVTLRYRKSEMVLKKKPTN